MNHWSNPQLGSVPDEADMRLNEGVVSDRVLNAYRKASKLLTKLRVPHTVIGGLAVGAWGHPRATKDVDFLVREKDAFSGGLVLSFRPGIPIEIDGVAIDYLTVESLKVRGKAPPAGPVAPIELLFAMKLKARRSQDDADLIALINNGADVDTIRHWLSTHGFREHLRRLDTLIERAEEEA